MPHRHRFIEGKCECGEEDPNYVPPHEHEYIEGKCECGEEDSNYEPPHKHEYIEGKCECGEEDPNYEPPHEHEYIEGKCECGEEDPNYKPPHIHDFYWDSYCPCGEYDDVHEFIDGECACGLIKNLGYKTIDEIYNISGETTIFSSYFSDTNCVIILTRNFLAPVIWYEKGNEFIEYFLSLIDVRYYNENCLSLENSKAEGVWSNMVASSHTTYAFRIFSTSDEVSNLSISVFSNGIIAISKGYEDYYSVVNINFQELQRKCYEYMR